MAVTIIDIAKDSKTSKSTVSRFLNGGSVKKDTAEAIKASIKKLNYHPNINARRLVTNKSHVIGVVLDDISNTYFSEVLAGIQAVAGASGYTCTFYSRASSRDRESDYLKSYNGGHIDGLIMGTFQKRSIGEIRKLEKSEFPIVLIGDNCDSRKVDFVDVDNAHGTIDEIEYLYRLGHRKIAYLRGPEQISGSSTRANGFIEGMKTCGLNSSCIIDTEWTVEGGYKAAEQIMENFDVTAVICSNEYCGYGAISGFLAAGLRVPEDISVVAFDDGILAKFSVPPITTVKQPFYKVGETAATHLLSLMSNDSNTKAGILLQTNLVERDSSGEAPEVGIREKLRTISLKGGE